MGVAPMAQTGVLAQVFVAHVVAADKGHPAVHHHDLAVVAEVELEPVAPAQGGVEIRDMGASSR